MTYHRFICLVFSKVGRPISIPRKLKHIILGVAREQKQRPWGKLLLLVVNSLGKQHIHVHVIIWLCFVKGHQLVWVPGWYIIIQTLHYISCFGDFHCVNIVTIFCLPIHCMWALYNVHFECILFWHPNYYTLGGQQWSEALWSCNLWCKRPLILDHKINKFRYMVI